MTGRRSIHIVYEGSFFENALEMTVFGLLSEDSEKDFENCDCKKYPSSF